MEADAQVRHPVRFSTFELNLDTGELSQQGVRIRIHGQPIEVLRMLVENPGAVVTRETLQKALWPKDVFVDFEHSLNSTINRLREALGDSAEGPHVIETIPRIGYRFIATITNLDGETPDLAGKYQQSRIFSATSREQPPLVQQPATSARTAHSRKRFWRWCSAAFAFSLLPFGIWHLRLRTLSPKIVEYKLIVHDSNGKIPVGTDGSRIYLDDFADTTPIAFAEIASGHMTHLPVPLSDPWLMSLSPDGANLLVGSDEPGLWIVRVPEGALRRILEQRVYSAAWSPDGEHIAIATASGDIVSVQKNGGGLRPIAERVLARQVGPAPYRSEDANDLVWSPDGSRIRFTRDRRFWEVSADGAGLHEVIPEWRPEYGQCCGAWTADGSLFLFVAGESVLKSAQAQPSAQIFSIDEKRLPGLRQHQPIQLTSAPVRWGKPVPNKFGNKVFSRGVILRGQLMRFDRSLAQFKPFLGGISAEHVAFSADGRWLLYVTYPEGILWRARSDGSDAIQLTEPPFYPKLPHFSADATQVLFFDTDSMGRTQSFVVSSQGGRPEPIFSKYTEPQDDANWSPDGKSIVYGTVNSDGTRIIKILQLRSRAVTVVPDSNGKYSPRWSPDGRYLAALESPPDKLAVFDFDTQKWRLLDSHWDGLPCWSRDSKYIYFVSPFRGLGIYKVRPTGGEIELELDLRNVRPTGVLDGWWDMDPNGAPMVMRDVGSDNIYALTLTHE